MHRRDIEAELAKAASYFPVVTVTGPRQSGKTTLCRARFPNLPYLSLEAIAEREQAVADPRAFLDRFPDGAVLDEIQRAPGLLSEIQGRVDDDRRPGRFVLTGSQNLALVDGVAQSLAGRTSLLELLPLALPELRRFPDAPVALWETLWSGSFPAVFDRGIPADRWLAAYTDTYLTRDVRQLLRVGDLERFSTFLTLAAARTGRLLNRSELGADVGVTHDTVRAWLSVLEASYLARRLLAWHVNARKSLARGPKLHLLDTGLVCHLLGIRRPQDLAVHPLRGAIFESWVVAEATKSAANRGLRARLQHFRDRKGLEADLVVDRGADVLVVEMKSGTAVAGDALGPLHRVAAIIESAGPFPRPVRKAVVYGGGDRYRRGDVDIVPWSEVGSIDWVGDGTGGPEPEED